MKNPVDGFKLHSDYHYTCSVNIDGLVVQPTIRTRHAEEILNVIFVLKLGLLTYSTEFSGDTEVAEQQKDGVVVPCDLHVTV